MPAIFFIATACAASWGLYYSLTPHVPKNMETLVLAAYMFGPLVAALATTALFRRGAFQERLALHFRFNAWWVVAWIMPPLLVVAAFAVALYGFGVETQPFKDGALAAARAAGAPVTPEMTAKIPSFPVIILVSMAAGILPNAIAAFGEEAGWRGFLWSELRSLGFWKASAIVGLVWGLWHAPVIMNGFNYGTAYQGFPWLGVAAMSGFCMLLTPFMALLRERTGSVFPPAIFHGTMNAIAGVFYVMEKDMTPIIHAFPGLAGMIVLAVLCLVVAALRPNRTIH